MGRAGRGPARRGRSGPAGQRAPGAGADARPGRNGKRANAAAAGHGIRRQNAGRAGLADRAGHGYAAQLCERDAAGGRTAAERGLQAGADGQGRAVARADRPAAFPHRGGAGAGATGADAGAARRCAKRFTAL